MTLPLAAEWAEADTIMAKADTIMAEADKTMADAAKLRAQADKRQADGAKRWADGYTLRAEANVTWWAAVAAHYGDGEGEWDDRSFAVAGHRYEVITPPQSEDDGQ